MPPPPSFLLLPFAISLLLLLSSATPWKPPYQWTNIVATLSTDDSTYPPEYGGSFRQLGLYDSSSTFALGFFNTTPNQFTLSLAMNIDGGGNKAPAIRIVWTANRNNPVSNNATLTFQTDGNLILRDANGIVNWSTNTSNKGVTAMDLLPSGNFVLNSSNLSVWQSFDHPTDTILVDQILTPGMKLISRVSDSDSSEGMYAMVMHPGGLALYANFPDPQPYWIWSYYGINDSLSVTHACEHPVSVTLWVATDVYLQMSQTNASLAPDSKQESLCTSAPSTAEVNYLLVNGREGHTQSFLRIDSDGVLRVYSLAQLGVWTISFQMYQGSQSCLLPQKCAPFGICGNDGNCNGCPLADGQVGQWSNCASPKLPSCQNATATNSNPDSSLEFSQFSGMDYFSNKFEASQMISTTIEECENRCLHNCSCIAFFYWNDSGFCFLAEQLATLLQVTNANHLAFFKMAATNITNANKSGSSQTIIVISASLIGAVLVICILLYAFRKAKSRRNDNSSEATDEDSLIGTLHESTLVRFKYKELQVITNDFRDVLGRGGFGIVYEGVLSNGRRVAVKRLESKSQGWKEFKAEITTLGALHHWNLVQLLGFCADKDHRLLVYEFLSNGSLDSWLFNEATPPLSWKSRFEIALGAARGLAYLHEECKERIIHLDVKPQNILLDDSFVAKVADFGLSRLMQRDESFVVTTMRGTPGYLAPEWLLQSVITEKADVYSFGMVLLEIVAGRRNLIRGVVEDSEKRYFPSWALQKLQEGEEMELVDERLQEAGDSSFDEDEAKRMVSIVFLCIQEDVGLRPSMSKVVKMLEGSMAVPELPMDQGLQFSLKSRALATLRTVEEEAESSALHGGGVLFSSTRSGNLVI